MTEKNEDPSEIWLAPKCHEGAGGREWCVDDVWPECGCGGGHRPVKFLLASVIEEQMRDLKTRNQALQRGDDVLDMM